MGVTVFELNEGPGVVHSDGGFEFCFWKSEKKKLNYFVSHLQSLASSFNEMMQEMVNYQYMNLDIIIILFKTVTR